MQVNTGITEFVLQYEDRLIKTGEFKICVKALEDNLEGCGYGFNSKEEKPENIIVNIIRDFRYLSL